MLTFKLFRRKDEAYDLLSKEDHPGWEQTILVYKGTTLMCQINTAQAYCCGWNTLEKVAGLQWLSSEEIPIFWQEVSNYLQEGGPQEFPVSQLFLLHNESYQISRFYKESKGELVYSYVSASEPNHFTCLYKFNLCSS